MVYASKISEDFHSGKLGPSNESLEPSAEERLTAEEAKAKALQVNSDIVWINLWICITLSFWSE